jgi:heme exporter protein A
VIPPGVAEVEASAREYLRTRLFQEPPDLVAVVHDEAEVARVVGLLRPALAQHEELVAHVDEGHARHAAAQLDVEQATVELECAVEVTHLEHDVVDAHETRHGLSIGFADMEPAIELDGLERRYGERLALAGVSVSVPRGATLAVLGANGAGKTTLLRVLAGLLRPHGGTARVLGAELPRERWKVPGRVGYLGHDPLLYRELSGRENLAYHAALHGVGRERIERLLAAVGMERRADEPVRDLSRGMVQRLAVARTVLHDPELLLLDEPRANLDPAAAERLEPLIGRESGRTRVLVSHDVEGALAESDLALGLKAGRPAAADRELYR